MISPRYTIHSPDLEVALFLRFHSPSQSLRIAAHDARGWFLCSKPKIENPLFSSTWWLRLGSIASTR
jgi:hypothetical protein